MLDINFIRENKDIIKSAIQKKHVDFNIEEFLAVDDERRVVLSYMEHLRSAGDEESMRDLSKEEEKFAGIMTRWKKLMVHVPNIPDISVHEGENASQNIEVRAGGEIPKFSFEARSAEVIMRSLGILECKEMPQKKCVIKNDGVMLSLSLWHFVADIFSQKGFTPIVVPSSLDKRTFIGVGQLPHDEASLQKIEDEKFLAKDSATGVMDLCSDLIFEVADIPKKFVSFSWCFSKIQGVGYSFDTSQESLNFEQVVLCEASHMTSVAFFEELTKNIEEVLSALQLPYRVMSHCGGALQLGDVKKYSVEVWVPSEKKYHSMFSVTYHHDFQSRRLNIKYRDPAEKMRFVHSVVGGGAMTPQLLFALIENNQRMECAVNIPEVLQKYFGKKEILAPVPYVKKSDITL